MINPNDVEILVFDLDGTILQSEKANFEAIKKALFELGWNVTITEEDLSKHLGETSERAYKGILPPDKIPMWEELRKKVREQYVPTISNYGKAFPGVIETLKILKKRSYKLALYTNSSVQYFNVAVSFLGIKKYFDHTECIQENSLTKIELVRKIIDKFPNLGVAVIGDRIHDIEAAKENNALSIGILYGYGKDEPQKQILQ